MCVDYIYIMSNKVLFSMGLPGAGKSYVLENEYSEFCKKATMIDPDSIKRERKDFDNNNPSIYHNWSCEVADQRIESYSDYGFDLIIDGTGTNFEAMLRKIALLKEKGYETELVYVKVSLETALKRNQERPRHVPEEIILKKATQIREAFNIVSNFIDKINVIINE